MPRRTFTVMATAALVVLAGLTPAPASAEPKDPSAGASAANPWQVRHWPQTQPWQRTQPPGRTYPSGAPKPVDPQNYELPDTMTWDDYKAVPGTHWNDPAVKGSVRNFNGALVLVDFPNQPFVVTQPAGSTVYGNPSSVHDLARADVPAFYRDFLNKPGTLNKGHTIHEYWMEDSGGRYGIDLSSYGVYQMPAKSHEYGIEASMQRGAGCPAGDTCARDFRTDARNAWVAAVGQQEASKYDFVFFLAAGQDESSTWQEFGQMKFNTKEEVSEPFGPPDPNLPNWNNTRYVDWTSWAASSNIWPNAGGGSSIQAESSGMSTYAHEFSHILGVGDNYNNPYSVPARRDYSGPWEMLSRGTFNGPGGPHSRWLIPATAGSSAGAQHMLRNKLKLGIVDTTNVLQLSSAGVAASGVLVARVTAREVQPGKSGLAGITIALNGGDKSPACNTDTDPMCDGGGYDNYTLEVVDRMGFDSFTPDSGVLLAKTKNEDDAPFIWTIDANPQDIDKVDFVLPNGTPQKMTIGDYRQLSDALFHAGTDSGSEYEFVDQANRLHFYVLDLQRSRTGVLSYTVAVRSLDGSGPNTHGVTAYPGAGLADRDGWARCTIPVRNTGRTGAVPAAVKPYAGSDVFRVSATSADKGWTTWLPRAVASIDNGQSSTVDVYVKRGAGVRKGAEVKVNVTSESDPSATSTTSCLVR